MADLRIREQKAASKTVFSKLSGKVSGANVGKQLVLYYKDHPGALLEDAANHIGWSVPAVSKEISALVDVGVFHAEKQGRRKAPVRS